MTAPTSAGPGTQVPFPIPANGRPVPVTDLGNSPVGALLINRGDNNGTVWVQAGPTGRDGVLPLGPGASLRWTDRQQIPYVLSTTTDETVVLTSQATEYSNPAAVATATAINLANKGIPSVLVNDQLYSDTIPVNGLSPTLDVSRYASLVVTASWYSNQLPLGPACARLTFTAASGQTAVQTISSSTLRTGGPESTTWTVPVQAGSLRLQNFGQPCTITITGTNRQVPKFAQLGEEMGIRILYAACPNQGQQYNLGPLPGTNPLGVNYNSSVSRFNGNVQLLTGTQGISGILRMYHVDANCNEQLFQFFTGTGGAERYEFAHPSVPVGWAYIPNTSSGSNSFGLQIISKS